jgi:Ras GTPase-activating-like protein IQGAP2/3
LNHDSVPWKVLSLPKYALTVDPDAEDKALLMQTKRCVLYIIRIQTGESLVDILCKQPTEEDDLKWSQLLHEEMPSQKNRTPYAEALFYDLAE